mgnify:CR=1 FL=1
MDLLYLLVILMGIYYICKMDTEEQIFRDVAFSLDIDDDIYQKTINKFNILLPIIFRKY